jgi:hypothetical protein
MWFAKSDSSDGSELSQSRAENLFTLRHQVSREEGKQLRNLLAHLQENRSICGLALCCCGLYSTQPSKTLMMTKSSTKSSSQFTSVNPFLANLIFSGVIC